MSLHGNNELYFNPYKEIDDYVYRSLNILNIDIGYNTHTEIGWSSIYNISEQNGLAIHNAVTKAYKDIYKTTPVEYLCKYIENNQELFARNDVYAFTVEASNKTFIKNDDGTYEIRFNHNEDYEEEQKAITRISKDRSYKSISEANIVQQYVLQELSDKARREQIMTIDTGRNEFGIDSAGNLFDMSILSLYDKAKELFLLNNLASFNPNGKSDYELFEILQQIFIDVISAVYHDIYGERVVRTSNVIVYITRSKDTDDVYIHYAVIFSYHNGFLEDNSFLSYMSYVALNALSNNIFSLKQKANNESIKSAKAAIMSRNMSHNLGSHVMFYIKQKLQSVSKIINNDVLHNIITGSQLNIEELKEKLKNSNNIELPFLVGLGRFINYLQERQDYIATVATDYIPARSTISFKDFIYDELKPDLRYNRHHSSTGGTIAGWQPKNLLLDYIAYSEGYTSSDKIEIKFGDFDGNTPTSSDGKKHFQALREFNVAVPGGVIGRQAIFSIVENIIRNAAKHSDRTKGKLVIEMSLVTAEDIMNWGEKGTNMLRCQRTENSEESGSELAKLYADEKHKNKFHYLRIKVDMPNKSKDIDAVVKKLGESYIDEGGGMKDSSKGLKEMRISAAWLRGHSIDTGIPTEEPPVLAVYSEKYKETTDKETLSYILCIPKPCKVAFVVDKEHLTYVEANDKVASYMDLNPILEPLGCAVFGYDGETNELTKNEQSKESKYKISDIADYEIVCMLLDGTQESKKVNSILPYISSRHITNGKTTRKILDTLKKTSDKKSTIDSIYEYWFNSWLGDKSPSENSRLLIIDDNAYEKHKEQRPDKDENASSTFDRVKCLAVGTAEEDDCKDAVIYSTHFAGLYNEYRGKKEGDNVKSGYEKLQLGTCIEAITGNNSTDRLIRHDEWTTEWKYKHLSAGLARVAIFDERIFGSFITSKDDYAVDRNKVSDLLKNHEQQPMSQNAIKEILINLNFKDHHAKSLAEAIISGRSINWESFYDKYNVPEYNGQVAQKNYERRIWAFDIQVDKSSANTMKILGYAANINANPDWAEDNIKKPPIVIATLKAENGEYVVTLSKEGENIFPNGDSQIFDYITIHQGILDKIYNVFGIKDKKDEKYKVTNALYNRFSRLAISENATIKASTDATDSKTATVFLPNFIIHSGRSKPNEQDMPQHQPFVQFAAVDHAVKDCKYTLVELLATAHYEKCSNNN